MKNENRTNYRTKREMNMALYKARLVLRRKYPDIHELRDAAETLNKAVRTLQSWLGNANNRKRWDAEDEAWRRLNSVTREGGSLIPLHYKD